ncbi:photosystem I reaction center subunit XII [Crocosphaera sp.]|uniref:photosystem I reaction center subunit XII n=1 Tax=Crocosphaera sp. TaxID=2729996 RepID=UPI00262B2A86|nr:photosystem I reaction center subunit XII [Crocosphaera sp.]MDJ0579087.1 photosystem I reaction center subunit XII [Crocosphaera sp.]
MTELTLAQQFEMQRIRNATKTMTKKQAVDLLVQATRLLTIKNNVIRSLGK